VSWLKDTWGISGMTVLGLTDRTTLQVINTMPICLRNGRRKNFQNLGFTEIEFNMLLTCTTSKRPDLFRRTMESFWSQCREIAGIDYVALFDDGSDEAQIANMSETMHKLKVPWHFANVELLDGQVIGHAANMNRVLDYLAKDQWDMAMFLEDDWELTSQGCPILAAMDVLLNNPKVGQVCLGVARNNDWKVRRTRTGTSFTIRPNKNGTDPNPAFTLNPCVMRTAALKDVGRFEDVDGFEAEYGNRWQDKGWLTAELVPHFLEHIGDGNSAYDLNNTKR
jgi:hypothetical protein